MHRALTLALLAGLGSAPALAQITVTGSAVEERAARPGESYAGTLHLRNEGSQAAEARLYLTDYTFSADGRSTYGPPGSLARSSARWVRFSPSHVSLPPGGTATVGYTVSVPAEPALAGTYWSMLMVEGIAQGSAESTAARAARVQVGIEPAVRYGVQLATTVTGTGTQAVEFASVRAYAGGTGKVLEFDLANAGDVACRPEIRVEVYDEGGRPAGTFTSRRGLLYPGTSLRQRFDLGALPSGTYQALLVADTGGEEVFGAQYRLIL